jgi:hypothetical protein
LVFGSNIFTVARNEEKKPITKESYAFRSGGGNPWCGCLATYMYF